jgi:hypothetical protein
MNLPKIKFTSITDESLERVKEINIRKCQQLYQSFPIATKVWMALKTKFTMKFIVENWEEITK